MTIKGLLREGNFNGCTLVSVDYKKGVAQFVCDCGASFQRATSSSNRNGRTIKCRSCQQRARKPHAGERYVIRRIRADAKNAGRAFDISLEWFVKQAHAPCHYCGRKDRNSINVASKVLTPLLVNFRYNGLDRIDNNVGYTEENCVPACFVCNRAKNSMTYNEFMEYLEDLTQFRDAQKRDTNEYTGSLHSERIYDRGGPDQAGEHSLLEESPKDSISVSTFGPYRDGIVGGPNEWVRGFGGGPYRNVERAIQAEEES